MCWYDRRLALPPSALRVAILGAALGLGALSSLHGQTAEIAVDKTVDPLTRPAPGGTFTFTVVVANTGEDTVTIASLIDDVYGDLTIFPGSSCADAVGTILAIGQNYGCSFTASFTGISGASQTDTVTATATGPAQEQAEASDGATVTLTAATAIAVDKTADPLTLPAPGGTFTFNVVITNTGSNTVTITDLTDDIYGDLTALGTCTDAVGTVLIAGATYDCSFQGNFTGVAGASQTDTVTATASEPQAEEVTASDSATVTLGPARSIAVDKTVVPSSLDAPGGTFTFSVLVTNTGDVTVTIAALDDDVYGDLTTPRPGSDCDTALGTSLAPDETYSCSFTGTFNGAAGDSQTDTVTAAALDGDDVVTASDDATVTLTQPPFGIAVDKSVIPTTRPEPGGAFTFTVMVTNVGTETVTITALTDDIYGNLATLPGSTCTNAIGTVLTSGATYSCSFTGNFAGDAGDSQTDTATATATGPQGPVVTGEDDAVVSLTDVLPAITVDKTASPPSLPAPGGAFTFSVLVTNTGAEAVTIVSLTDDVYGDLGVVMAGSTCNTAPGTILTAGGGSYSCSFTRQFTGSAGASQTDTVTAVVRDDDDNEDSAGDSATVSISGLTEIPTLDARALALLAVALAALGIVALRRLAG